MQRKSIIVPIIALLTIGAVWASTSLFPDRGDLGLSSLPVGSGTLGGVLTGLFGSDGTARDTQKLGGVSASGYLQGSACPPNQVWQGIDAGGSARCGTKATLLAIGKFSELTPGVQVMKGGSLPWISANTNDTLQSGDIIQTNGGTATIRFAADESILRLDTSTLVQLDTGNLGGNTVAQAILQDGRLWGRVLTSTGVNIGGGGLIAGVRGTSVSVEKDSPLMILDSQVPNEAGTLSVVNGSTPSTRILTAPYRSDATAGVTKSSLLTTSVWARENMKKDIAYLSSLPQVGRVPGELAIATPQSTAERDAICLDANGQDGGRWWSSTVGCKDKNIIAFADYTRLTTDMTIGYAGAVSNRHIENTCYNRPFPYPYYNTSLLGAASCYLPISIECDPTQVQVTHTATCNPVVDGTKTYHPILKEDIPFGQNGRQADCVIMDEYGNPGLLNQELDANMGGAKLDIWCASPGTQNIQNIGSVPTPSTNGVLIEGSSYLKYTGLDLNMLKGKTVTVELLNPVSSTAVNSSQNLLYLGTQGLVTYVTTTSSTSVRGWACKVGTTSAYSCTNPTDRSTQIWIEENNQGKSIVIHIPANLNIDEFILGNGRKSSSPYTIQFPFTTSRLLNVSISN